MSGRFLVELFDDSRTEIERFCNHLDWAMALRET
jgi:hypothetical protein